MEGEGSDPLIHQYVLADCTRVFTAAENVEDSPLSHFDVFLPECQLPWFLPGVSSQ